MPTWVLKALRAGRKVPWSKVLAAIVWLNVEGRRYWNRLSPAERAEARELAVRSRGRRSNLTKAEQERLVDLFAKIRRGEDGG